jgi:hypothetical protein
MKKCTYCGLENPDEAEMCGTCHTEFVAATQAMQPEPDSEYVISADEQRFWERMTFRQFAIVIVRLQAVWLLFYAVIDATYLPSYFARARGAYSPLYTTVFMNSPLFFAILRILLHVALAIALIQYAERVLSWLVKDSIPKPLPPEKQDAQTVDNQ